jgi:AraC-like DNA-binding protein
VKEHSPAAAREIRRLEGCIRDLLCVSAIPALSRSLPPAQLIAALFDVLIGTLHLDLAYGEVLAGDPDPPLSLVRFAPAKPHAELPLNFRVAANAWLADPTRTSPHIARTRHAGESVSLVLMDLGLSVRLGWLLVCTRRKDFPTPIESLVLRVATNNAILSLQQQQLLSQQTAISQELDLRVQEKTLELRAANHELQQALKQVDALRDGLQRDNLALREQTAPARGGLSPWELRRVKALMTENLAGPVPLKQLAHVCALSERHFTRSFRQSTGVSPHRWLLLRRVDRAKEMLPNAALSLSDVALACGFGDQSHFSRTFSAAVGLSPGLWRRLQSLPSALLAPTTSGSAPRTRSKSPKAQDRSRARINGSAAAPRSGSR